MRAMSSKSVLFGFHAVTVRLKTHPDSVAELHFDPTRRDQRMRAFIERAKEAGAKLVESSDERLTQLAGSPRHQGVVARVAAIGVGRHTAMVLSLGTPEPSAAQQVQGQR